MTVGLTAETAMPEAVGDDGGIRASRGHLGGIETTSELRRHSQQAEEIAGDARGRDLLGLALAAEARADRVIDGDAREALRLVPDRFVFGERHGDGARLRVRRDLRDRDQFLRVAEGERPQEDGVHHAEDRGGGADAESQGENGDRAETRVLNDPPQTVADVLKEGSHLRDLTLVGVGCDGMRAKGNGFVAAMFTAAGLASAAGARGAEPAASQVDPFVARPRVIVMTDIANEPDDQMSMVRFLLYSNGFDVEGLVATTSTWMKKTVRPDVIHSVLDAYEKVQPNLLTHAPGYPAAAALRAVVVPGQPGYGMAAVGAGKTSRGRRADPPGRAEGGRAAALGPGLGRHEHAGPGAARRARHAHAGGGRGDRREAPRLHDLRPGRRRALAPPRVPGPALHRHAVDPGRRGVLPRDLDRDQRRPLLSERARRGLHDLLRRVGQREHPQQGAARQALSRSPAASTKATRRRSWASSTTAWRAR